MERAVTMPQEASSLVPLHFKVHGMDCAEEVGILKRAVGPLIGAADMLTFDVLNGKMTVAAAADVSPAAVVDAVRRTGMRAELWRDAAERREELGRWERYGRAVLTAVSGALLVSGFTLHAVLARGVGAALGSEGLGIAHDVPITVRILYSGAIVAGAWFVAPKAWNSARHLRPDMNLLMMLAVAGAVVLGEWFEAATVAFLFALSLALEAWSIGRARRAVSALMALAPPVARRMLPDGQFVEVPPESVVTGSRLLVKPGEKIPLDGIVLSGASDVNQAPITGESVPVSKVPGAPVFAGTINGDGALEIQSTKVAADTTLARIVAMVADAQSRRAPAEQWVERFARVYTPAVFAAALAVMVIPPLMSGAAWSGWVYRALVLLVIGCPCALVISTPVTIVAALAAAARNGVLIKGGLFVELPARLRAVAFDKTGTLTAGTLRVTHVEGLNGHTSAEVLERAAALEVRADHPIARAVLAYADAMHVVPPAAGEFRIMQGKGAIGTVAGKTYWIGSHRYLEDRGQETPVVHDALEQLTTQGQTVVVVGTDEHVCGFLALADTVRAEASRVVSALRKQGIQHVVMLTGDNRGTARAVAESTGIDEVHADLLPADKVAVVEALVGKYGQVGMVGDGVNDAPAMARATVAIAMGAAGTDAAIETADVALMADDLTKIPWLIAHSRRAVGIVRQNIVLSLAVKAVFVVLTFAGAASLWAAIGADMGVSLLVISNALRLLRGQGLVAGVAS
jgi:Zn2+/Cd2+-exporting ATPase